MQDEYKDAVNELSTVRDVLRWGISQFNQSELHYGHGTDNAWDEALQLILSVIHLPNDVGDELLSCRLTQSERQDIIELFEQRVKQKVPVPYLTHRAWFAGLEFYVDEQVLIPRSPMAELLENQCQPWIEPGKVHQILDLCTGSGCIAIAAAHYFPEAMVDGTDISEAALSIADKNRQRYQLQQRVHFIQSDIFEQVATKQYDIIISNPPYVDAEDMASLPDEYRHEPVLGLAAGEDGLLLVDRILQQAKHYLSPHGILLVEVGNSAEALIKKYPTLAFTWLEFERGGEGVFLLTAKQLGI